MSTTTSGSIRFSGLGSGTDFDSIITQLLEIEKSHMYKLQSWRTEWEDKSAAFDELSSAMLSLDSTLQDMNTTEEFLIKQASSSNSTAITANATSAGEIGSHVLTVNRLATTDVHMGNTVFASSTTSVTSTAAQFSLTYASAHAITIDVPANATLSQVATLINSDPENQNYVKASLVNDGTGYRLQLRGMDLGDGNNIVINDTVTTLADFKAAKFDTAQAAQDAQLKLDGWPASGYIERSTNSVDDLVSGVTLNLLATGTSTITTSVDNDAILESVQTFVEQVNTVIQLVQEQTKVTTSGESANGSILTGNYGVQFISQSIKNILVEKGIGFDRNLDALTSLASVGITTDSDEGSATFGQLILDESAFTDALSADPDSVAKLFSADYDIDAYETIGSTTTTAANYKVASLIRGVTAAGEYAISYTVSGGAVTSATINGYPAGIDGNKITAVGSSNAARGLALEVVNLTAGTVNGKVQIKSGKIEELSAKVQQMTDSNNGTLEILKNNYQDIMDAIDDKIAYEETRFTLKEQNLRRKFANLESVLGTYDSISTQLSSQIKSLSSSSG